MKKEKFVYLREVELKAKLKRIKGGKILGEHTPSLKAIDDMFS